MRRALKPHERHQFPPRTGFGEKDRTRFAPIALHRSKSLLPRTWSERQFKLGAIGV
jgi:hypothetical protein